MGQMQVVIFKIEEERYGVPIHQVQSIERWMETTRVPKTLSFIKGVVNLRGTITPVIDVRERFGMSTKEADDDTRIVVVGIDAMTVGMVVDAVLDVVMVDEEEVKEPPRVVGGVAAEYLNGVVSLASGVLVLLNLGRILSDVEERQLREVEKSVHG